MGISLIEKDGKRLSEEKIGIKIADGTFFPILEEDSLKKKRLVLTTVNDNQSSVQIDLYKGKGENFTDPAYVGSLMINSIAPVEKGIPEIELKIGLDEENVLNTTAKDLASGTEESLSVSLESLSDETTYDVPEFSLEDDFDENEYDDMDLEETGEDDSDFSFDDAEVPDEAPANEDDEPPIFNKESDRNTEPADESYYAAPSGRSENKEKHRLHPLLIALFVLLSLVVLAGLVYFVYNSFSGKDAPVLQAEKATPEKNTPSVKNVPVQNVQPSTEVKKTASVPAVSEAKKVSTGSPGVWYRIRWGDTLWGISYSFYRSPKLYAKIVRENKIKNPHLIFAETKIFIPKE